jgi:type I restriction enzyme, S subunit
MNLETFFQKFDLVADTPDAVSKMREFVLDWAVQGKLSEQRSEDADDLEWLELIRRLDAEGNSTTAETETSFEIPDDWKWTTLESLGDTKPRNVAPDEAKSSFVPMTLIPAGFGLSAQHEVRPWGEIKKGYTHFQDDDVVMAKITPCFENGKSVVMNGLTGRIGAGTTELHVFRRSGPAILPEFVIIYLKSRGFITRGIPSMTGSAGQKRVPYDYFARSPFPLPPLAEQKRIVAKVDELMALCDRLEAQQQERETRHAALARASLARFADAPTPVNLNFIFHKSYDIAPADLRKTILTLAVQGKLVPQDPNDEPANVAAKSAKVTPSANGNEIPFELPSTWQWRKLGELSELINGDRSKNYPNKGEYVRSGIAWINTGHIEPDGTLSIETMHYITREKFDTLRSGKIQPDDLVYCLRGATLGKTAIVSQFREGAVASSLVIIRLSSLVDSKFAYYVLTSPLGRNEIQKFDNGSAQPNLSANSVKKYCFPLPPLAEQSRIVTKVDELMALVDALETKLATARTAAEKLMEAVVAELTASESTRIIKCPHRSLSPELM